MTDDTPDMDTLAHGALAVVQAAAMQFVNIRLGRIDSDALAAMQSGAAWIEIRMNLPHMTKFQLLLNWPDRRIANQVMVELEPNLPSGKVS